MRVSSQPAHFEQRFDDGMNKGICCPTEGYIFHLRLRFSFNFAIRFPEIVDNLLPAQDIPIWLLRLLPWPEAREIFGHGQGRPRKSGQALKNDDVITVVKKAHADLKTGAGDFVMPGSDRENPDTAAQ